MRKTPLKRMGRAKRAQRMLAVALTTGVCFQNVQCAVDTEELGVELLTTITTLIVTDYFYNAFGISTSPF